MRLPVYHGASGFPDLDAAVYRSGAALATSPNVSELGGGWYELSGLPEVEIADVHTVTHATANGADAVSYPAGRLPRSPEAVVLPSRDPAETAGDVSVTLYVDGVATLLPGLAVDEAPAGDWLISGLPLATTGEHTLIAESPSARRSWHWRVAEAGSLAAPISYSLAVGRLRDIWKTPALASLDPPITLSSPYGHDLICPVAESGMPFDPSESASVSPYTPDQVSGAGGAFGVGYLLASHVPAGDPEYREDGDPPQYRQRSILRVQIVTPRLRGPGLALQYAAALSSAFSWLYLPGSGSVDWIQNTNPPPTMPTALGDTDTGWSVDQLDIPLDIHYRADVRAAA